MVGLTQPGTASGRTRCAPRGAGRPLRPAGWRICRPPAGLRSGAGWAHSPETPASAALPRATCLTSLHAHASSCHRSSKLSHLDGCILCRPLHPWLVPRSPTAAATCPPSAGCVLSKTVSTQAAGQQPSLWQAGAAESPRSSTAGASTRTPPHQHGSELHGGLLGLGAP